MRTRMAVVVTALLAGGLALHAQAATALGTVSRPLAGSTGRGVVLLLLPDAGTTGSTVSSTVRAAQLAAGPTRLWVARPTASVAPADAEVVYSGLLAQVRAQGFPDATDGDVVVAGWGRGGESVQVLHQLHSLAGTAALDPTPDLAVSDLFVHYLSPGRVGPVVASARVVGTKGREHLVRVAVHDHGAGDRPLVVAMATVRHREADAATVR